MKPIELIMTQLLYNSIIISFISSLEMEEFKIIPPFRFGYVGEGLARGAYPTLRNFRHLSRLRLSTIISLVPEAPSLDLMEFAQAAGVTVIHVPILRTAPLNAALMTNLVFALNICLDFEKHPSVLVHCLDGRRISGLFVLLVRRLQGWNPLAAFSEYWRYQTVTKLPIATSELEKTTKELSKFFAEIPDVVKFTSTIPR